VTLREIEETDLDTIVKWRNDPDTIRYLFSYLPLNMHRQAKWFESYNADRTSQLFMIEDAADHCRIGTCGFTSIDYRNQRAELSIIIGEKNYLGRGYASEATRLLIDYGFLTLNLRKIYLQVLETNAAAIKLYRRLGFEVEGTLKEHYFQDGTFVNVILMSKFRQTVQG
jgi:diamine N-acetyltransferase